MLAGPASAGASGPLICVVAGEPDEEPEPVPLEGLRHALAKLRHAYELVVLHGPPLGDESGTLLEASRRAPTSHSRASGPRSPRDAPAAS